MSLDGLWTVRGSTVDVFRPTLGKTPSGASKTTWPVSPQVSAVRAFIEPLSAELADRVFGAERRAKHRGMLPLGTDVLEHDGLKVTAGESTGQKYQVVGIQSYDHSRRPHLELALIETTEAF